MLWCLLSRELNIQISKADLNGLHANLHIKCEGSRQAASMWVHACVRVHVRVFVDKFDTDRHDLFVMVIAPPPEHDYALCSRSTCCETGASSTLFFGHASCDVGKPFRS